MIDQNWTTIGNPGRAPGAIVGRDGLMAPRGASWSLDAWVMPEGEGLLAAETRPEGAVRQRLQDRLPVVATAFEARTIRLSSEAWCLEERGEEWAVAQAVVFNLSDDPATGRFFFALRPITPAGAGSIRSLAYEDGGFRVDGLSALWLSPEPDGGWDCLSGVGPAIPALDGVLGGRRRAEDSGGACLGVAAFEYRIAPWEEAEFTAWLPITSHGEQRPERLVARSYGLLKGEATRRWQEILRGGMQLSVPDARVAESWDANRGYLLVLAGGDPPGELDFAIALAGGAWVTEGESRPLAPALSRGEREIGPMGDSFEGHSLLSRLAPLTPALSQKGRGGKAVPRLPGLERRGQGEWDTERYMEDVRGLVRRGDGSAWEYVARLLGVAGPTFAWPEMIGGKGGHSLAATVAWLRLLSDMVVFEEGERLVLGAGVPGEWLAWPGEVVATEAPAGWGSLDLAMRWEQDDVLALEVSAEGGPPGGYEWRLPWPARVEVGGEEIARDAASWVMIPAVSRVEAIARRL